VLAQVITRRYRGGRPVSAGLLDVFEEDPLVEAAALGALAASDVASGINQRGKCRNGGLKVPGRSATARPG
jgi:hypothetical protein